MDGHHVWSIGVVRSTWHWRPLEVDGEGRSVRHVEGVDELLPLVDVGGIDSPEVSAGGSGIPPVGKENNKC